VKRHSMPSPLWPWLSPGFTATGQTKPRSGEATGRDGGEYFDQGVFVTPFRLAISRHVFAFKR
jgi:hypothetical protein